MRDVPLTEGLGVASFMKHLASQITKGWACSGNCCDGWIGRCCVDEFFNLEHLLASSRDHNLKLPELQRTGKPDAGMKITFLLRHNDVAHQQPGLWLQGMLM